MASNEEIIRDLYVVAEKEPKRFRSRFTQNGYWWDVPAGVKYHALIRMRPKLRLRPKRPDCFWMFASRFG